MSTLLACIDASTYANGVLDNAAWAANRLDASIEVVHILDHREIGPASHDHSGILGLGEQDSLLEEYVALEEQRHRLARRRGQVLLNGAVERLHAAGIVTVLPQQRHGTLVDAVAEMADGVQLIVIGKRGESANHARHDLGSNLERLARVVHTPMLVVPPGYRDIKRVMIAFDGGPAVRKAIDQIVALPLLRGGTYQLLMVDSTNDARRREHLAEAAQRLTNAGIEVSTEFLPGDPEHVIIDQIGLFQADLLVMGA